MQADPKTGVTGLSPLARGTPPGYACSFRTRRFIPAGAGNTACSSAEKPLSAVYPRWRGEHALKLTLPRLQNGLSPLARGTPSQSARGGFYRRFIPAGAGNTKCQYIAGRSRQVYPRWRGEHVFLLTLRITFSGLSPLARGTHLRMLHYSPQIRFIPAGAGNTSALRLPPPRQPVYPRWRGEHVSDVPAMN